ncbi:hypothetical protein AVEN_186577-1 [Araneus ventricosus]|uniref:Uncharacterized protein n=1 Tax=Araneus ventricosus TaxID=182803 RepID=A0A4Y2VMH7_ARAVE|nr:hypothetical protein AVEN_186577-1 [Araneus ventricosus]
MTVMFPGRKKGREIINPTNILSPGHGPTPPEGGTYYHWLEVFDPPTTSIPPGEARARLLIRRPFIRVLRCPPRGTQIACTLAASLIFLILACQDKLDVATLQQTSCKVTKHNRPTHLQNKFAVKLL